MKENEIIAKLSEYLDIQQNDSTGFFKEAERLFQEYEVTEFDFSEIIGLLSTKLEPDMLGSYQSLYRSFSKEQTAKMNQLKVSKEFNAEKEKHLN